MSNDTELHGTGDLSGEADLPAGCFSSWLRCTRLGLIKENEAFVQCGECNACCASSYFIHIRPDETQTLTAIPKALLFPAPGLPKGNVLMGYNEHGCCPMLTGGKCSIYEHRSQTCRSYDCRIFTAAGIIPDEAEKASEMSLSARLTVVFKTVEILGQILKTQYSRIPRTRREAIVEEMLNGPL